MRDIEKLISDANEVMREKLLENSHKPGWETLSIQENIRLSDLETNEIKMAVYIFEHGLRERKKALVELKREAADRMNFDAMLIQKCNSLLEKIDDQSKES